MPNVAVGSTTVDYATHGAGARTVVFMHGGFGSSAAIWRRAMKALSPEFTAFAPNLFTSGQPPGGYNVSSFADHLYAFVHALGRGRVVVVGHSMGGIVCQLLALRHGDELAGLVLVATG